MISVHHEMSRILVLRSIYLFSRIPKDLRSRVQACDIGHAQGRKEHFIWIRKSGGIILGAILGIGNSRTCSLKGKDKHITQCDMLSPAPQLSRLLVFPVHRQGGHQVKATPEKNPREKDSILQRSHFLPET